MALSDSPEPTLFRLTFRFPPENKEIVLGAIFSAGVTTIQEAELEKEDKGDTLFCYFESLAETKALDESVREFLNGLQEQVPIESELEAIESLDWVNEWKKYVKPVRFGSSLIVCPRDEVIEDKPGQHVVRIDPQLAFGTGAHETTRLVLRSMVEILERQAVKSMLDVGCGSGILSIVAKKFGVETVRGIDNKQRAIDVSIANAVFNDVKIPFSMDPLSEQESQYELVVANIISSVIISLWEDLKRSVQAGGTLLISGILLEEKEDFLAQLDLVPESIEVDGEWMSFRFLIQVDSN